MFKNTARWTLAGTVALCVALSGRGGAQAAMASCKDGSTTASGKGACSGHGGVDRKATKAAAAAMKSSKTVAVKPAPAMAKPVVAPTPAPMVKPAPVAKLTPAPTAVAKPAVAAVVAPAMAKPSMPKPMTTPKVVAPVTASNPGVPTAKCKDESLSYSKGHSGACSRHGGVAEWLDGTAKKP